MRAQNNLIKPAKICGQNAGKNLRPIQASRSSAGGAKAVGDLSIYLLSLE